MSTLVFWLLFLTFVGAFIAQVQRRVRIIAAGKNTFSLDNLGFRINRFILDVLLQRKTIVCVPFHGKQLNRAPTFAQRFLFSPQRGVDETKHA